MNPSAALQSVAEDFLESLDQSPAGAQAELVTCILRSCGCNHTIDSDQAVDYDGVVDALDNITEALKQDESPVYPLISKLAAFKPFRASLSEFLSRLVSSAAALGQLYATDLMATLQTWVIAMSSSQLRSFRHTASVVALEVETALCEVAAAVDKEAEVVSRQREGERKRKKGKSEPIAAREKELEGKAAEIRSRRTKLAEFLKEFVDGYVINPRCRLHMLTISLPGYSFIDIVTWTQTSAQNAYELWDYGSQNIPHISLMAPIFVTLAGFYPTQIRRFGWKL